MCLHSSYVVQISLQFDEFFDPKNFQILISRIFEISALNTSNQKLETPLISSLQILHPFFRYVAFQRLPKYCFVSTDTTSRLSGSSIVLKSSKHFRKYWESCDGSNDGTRGYKTIWGRALHCGRQRESGGGAMNSAKSGTTQSGNLM